MRLLASFVNGCLGAGATTACIYFQLSPGWSCLIGLIAGLAIAVVAALPSFMEGY